MVKPTFKSSLEIIAIIMNPVGQIAASHAQHVQLLCDLWLIHNDPQISKGAFGS